MSSGTRSVDIEGVVAPGFEGVRDAFVRNFTEHGDQGASVAVYVDGQPVIDLWGGLADPTTGRPWGKDSVALVYSVTKGATAVLFNLLAQRGEIDLDAPVAQYWPDFAMHGKETTTVRMVLAHRAGLPALEQTLTREQLIAHTPAATALAAQAPLWTPGTKHGYHALTFGWLTGEIVRRATGRTLGQVFATDVAQPLDLDFHIGLPPIDIGRIAPLINAAPPDPALIDAIEEPDVKAFVLKMAEAFGDPNSLLSRVLSSNGALPTPDAATWNDPRIYEMEQPAANGITNARSLAKMYASCVSGVDGVRLLTDATVDDATAEQSSGPDEVLMSPSRFGSGFMLMSPVATMLSESSFGHTGAGGALGFADRTSRLGFGYVQNQLGGGLLGEPRTAGLIEALRSAL